MALVFRGSCSQCGYESREVPARTLAILVTTPDEDRLRQLGQSPPVVLHPYLESVLEEFGLSFRKAAWGGQLVEIRNCICQACGRLTERRRLSAGGVAMGCSGCVLIAALGLLAGIAGSFATQNPFIGAAITITFCVVSMTAIEFSANRLVRWRYRERANAVDTPPGCGHCGSNNFFLVGSRDTGPFPCPVCGETAVRIQPIVRY